MQSFSLLPQTNLDCFLNLSGYVIVNNNHELSSGGGIALETLRYDNGDGNIDAKGLDRVCWLPSAFPPKVYLTKFTLKLPAFVNLCVCLPL